MFVALRYMNYLFILGDNDCSTTESSSLLNDF